MIFLSKVVCCFIIYWIVYYFNNIKNWGGVKASSVVAVGLGIIYQIIIYNQLKVDFLKDYFLIMMGATFMGMISIHHQHKIIDFLISSFIFCTLYQHTSQFFNGFGGLLGTIACISILCVFGIERIFSIIKKESTN